MQPYPRIEGDIILILDDYSNTATGKELKLDFHDIEVSTIKEEAKACILKKYNAKAASPTYLRVLIPAVRRFAIFAKENNIHSFKEYTNETGKAYLSYLNRLNETEGKSYTKNYIRYLWSVPQMMKNDIETNGQLPALESAGLKKPG